MSLKQFAKSLNENGPEGELIKTVVISIVTSFLFLGLLYIMKIKSFLDFLDKSGFYLFFAILSYSIILPSIRQVRSYKEFPCMTGMMIGMTTGMISGFLLGLYVSSTNGMFYGSIFGMTIGIFLGVWNGKCCGIMGVMESLMAGFMGGLMGAMTALMMLNDHLKAASVILFVISSVILMSLSYMVYKESRDLERKHKDDELFVVILSFIFTVVTVWFMMFGPKGGIFV